MCSTAFFPFNWKHSAPKILQVLLNNGVIGKSTEQQKSSKTQNLIKAQSSYDALSNFWEVGVGAQLNIYKSNVYIAP